MKALGARPGRLANVVVSQALWTVAAALAVALGALAPLIRVWRVDPMTVFRS